MKKIYIILITSLLLVSSSCNDWLDVSSRSIIKKDDLYTTEEGFKKSLIGVYILLGQKELYGKNTSMYLPELLARNWVTAPSTGVQLSEMYSISTYDYKDKNVEALLSTVWLSYYKAIAQLNDILEELETTNVSFLYNNEQLIKGEALGLRAFLHLELLRYFGPIPSASVSGENSIPYVSKVTKNPNDLISRPYSEVVELIEKDLIAAEDILLDYDPIIRFSNNTLNHPFNNNHLVKDHIKDEWQMKRQSRFNYYAVIGTKARLYQWIGDKEKAMTNAKLVIEAVSEDRPGEKFRLADNDALTQSTTSLTLLQEHLFSIVNPSLLEIVDPLFKGGLAPLMFVNQNLVTNTLYESAYYTADIRHYKSDRYWKSETYSSGIKRYHYAKYTGNNMYAADYRIPLIRVVEMYFILIENLPVGSVETAKYFTTYRDRRGLPSSLDTPTLESKEATMLRLEKEYRKEFLAEGQMFSFFKRLNYTSFTFPNNYLMDSKNYVVPKPNIQIVFE